MNGENLHQDVTQAFMKQVNALYVLIKQMLDIYIQEKRDVTEIEMLNEDAAKLKEITNKLKSNGIKEDTTLADAKSMLSAEDNATLDKIFNCYSMVVMPNEMVSDISDALKRKGIPHVTTQVRLEEGTNPNKMQSVIMYCVGPDRDIEKMRLWDKEVTNVARSGNIIKLRENENFGVLGKKEFKSIYEGRDEFVQLNNVDVTAIEIANDMLKKSRKAIGWDRGNDKSTRTVYAKASDKGTIMAQIALGNIYADTIYGKYLANKINVKAANKIDIARISRDLNSTHYICNGTNDYIKITPSGLDYYQDGTLISDLHVSRSDNVEKFVGSALKLAEKLRLEDCIIMDENDFTPDKIARRELYEKRTKNVELYVGDEDDAYMVKKAYTLRQPIANLFEKVDNRNYKAVLDKDFGINRIIGLHLRAALMERLNSTDYEAVKNTINSRPGMQFEVPSIDTIDAEAREAYAEAEIATEKFLDTVLIDASQDEKDKLKNEFGTFFNNSILGADLEQMLKLAQSVEKALVKAEEMEKDAVDLGPTLEEVINRNSGYRDEKEQSMGEHEKDEAEI